MWRKAQPGRPGQRTCCWLDCTRICLRGSGKTHSGSRVEARKARTNGQVRRMNMCRSGSLRSQQGTRGYSLQVSTPRRGCLQKHVDVIIGPSRVSHDGILSVLRAGRLDPLLCTSPLHDCLSQIMLIRYGPRPLFDLFADARPFMVPRMADD